jgi:ferrous iron transport protein B
MRKFGLSGKSVVPLVSGTACAIPAVMATRNIESWKERLITILVVPFTTCSARLPVYLIIIALVIPDRAVWGFNLQGLTLMLLYLLGFGVAIGSAWILNKILKIKNRSHFVIEMPNYKMPMGKNIAINVVEKTKSFVFGAGKIILAISIILWVLASYGPGDNFNNASEIVSEQYDAQSNITEEELDEEIASFKLKNSYIGIMGRGIEPVVAPLGYDWKIGIAIISSFAAREVFVGTLATIYSVGSDEEETIKNRMAAEINPILGGPLFTFASGVSLLLFYAFAMQCMSTLAIVKKETNTWKWPVLQLVVMTLFAYFVALAAFQLLK